MQTLIIIIACIAIMVVAAALVLIGSLFIRPTPRNVSHKYEVRLKPCYSLNRFGYLNINGRLPEVEDVSYDLKLNQLLFSPQGDVYIRRKFLNRSVAWEHFSPEGESLGLIKKAEIYQMVDQKQIGRAASCISEMEHVNLTIWLEL